MGGNAKEACKLRRELEVVVATRGGDKWRLSAELPMVVPNSQWAARGTKQVKGTMAGAR